MYSCLHTLSTNFKRLDTYRLDNIESQLLSIHGTLIAEQKCWNAAHQKGWHANPSNSVFHTFIVTSIGCFNDLTILSIISVRPMARSRGFQNNFLLKRDCKKVPHTSRRYNRRMKFGGCVVYTNFYRVLSCKRIFPSPNNANQNEYTKYFPSYQKFCYICIQIWYWTTAKYNN